MKFRVGLVVFLLSMSSLGAYYWIKSSINPNRSPSEVTQVRKKVKIKEVKQGSLMKAILKEAIYQNNSEFETCYDSYLRREPEVSEGSLRLEWTVNSEGSPQDFEISSANLTESAFHDCMKTALSKISFKENFAPGVRVAHKFNFKQKTPNEVVFR